MAAAASTPVSTPLHPSKHERKRPSYYREVSDADQRLQTPRNEPRSRQNTSDTQLFPVTIVDDDGSRYKVHYVGYSSSYDEWKEYGDVEELDNAIEMNSEDNCISRVEPLPYSLYNELAHRIKASLRSGRKESPVVRIDMSFDRITFDGGLGVCGVKKVFTHGTQRYTISTYKDLNQLLGVDWHVRGLNENGDFCYVILNTLVYYLYRRRPLKEYVATPAGHANDECEVAPIQSEILGWVQSKIWCESNPKFWGGLNPKSRDGSKHKMSWLQSKIGGLIHNFGDPIQNRGSSNPKPHPTHTAPPPWVPPGQNTHVNFGTNNLP